MKKETIKTMDARRLCGRWMAAIAFSLLYFTGMEAQNMSDSIAVDSIRREMGIGQKTIDKGTKAVAELPLMLNDTTVAGKKRKVKRDWSPDPQKALWMALVIPGGGQIYNRKYWKLPLVYGGFMGCLYAMSWNNMMYKDYSQAYLDIMDSDPNTKSYEKMLPMGYDITGKEDRFKEIFKNKKNHFRRFRDLSIFAFAGVYLLSVVDAYVDAELSSFDISQDLSMHVEPAMMQTYTQEGGRQHRKIPALTVSLNF